MGRREGEVKFSIGHFEVEVLRGTLSLLLMAFTKLRSGNRSSHRNDISSEVMSPEFFS